MLDFRNLAPGYPGAAQYERLSEIAIHAVALLVDSELGGAV